MWAKNKIISRRTHQQVFSKIATLILFANSQQLTLFSKFDLRKRWIIQFMFIKHHQLFLYKWIFGTQNKITLHFTYWICQKPEKLLQYCSKHGRLIMEFTLMVKWRYNDDAFILIYWRCRNATWFYQNEMFYFSFLYTFFVYY